jgi:hypothetical protein
MNVVLVDVQDALDAVEKKSRRWVVLAIFKLDASSAEQMAAMWHRTERFGARIWCSTTPVWVWRPDLGKIPQRLEWVLALMRWAVHGPRNLT